MFEGDWHQDKDFKALAKEINSVTEQRIGRIEEEYEKEGRHLKKARKIRKRKNKKARKCRKVNRGRNKKGKRCRR